MAAVAVLLIVGLAWAAQGRHVQVTVTYQGSGAVSADHAIDLSVWDSQDIAGGVIMPIATQVVGENGGTVSFTVHTSPVCLAALYDEQGGDSLTTGVVPSGMPAAVYNPDGVGNPGAIEVRAGQTVDVAFTFDDAFRMP